MRCFCGAGNLGPLVEWSRSAAREGLVGPLNQRVRSAFLGVAATLNFHPWCPFAYSEQSPAQPASCLWGCCPFAMRRDVGAWKGHLFHRNRARQKHHPGFPFPERNPMWGSTLSSWLLPATRKGGQEDRDAAQAGWAFLQRTCSNPELLRRVKPLLLGPQGGVVFGSDGGVGGKAPTEEGGRKALARLARFCPLLRTLPTTCSSLCPQFPSPASQECHGSRAPPTPETHWARGSASSQSRREGAKRQRL